MSEKLSSVEQHEVGTVVTPETVRVASPEHHEKLKHHHEAQAAHKAEKAREQAKQAAETAAKPLERLEAAAEDSAPVQPLNVNRELKAITLRRELKNIQRKLPASQRVLSRWIHKPTVRIASEVAGKTVTRPSGLLGGGLVAFLGTTGYLILAKNAGLEYNYLVFLVLFVGGYIIGLVLEYVVYLATVSHRQHGD